MESNKLQTINLTSQEELLRYCKEVRPVSVKDSIESPSGSIRMMIETTGEVNVQIMVVFFITDLVGFFNFSRTMNSNQIAQTTSLIIEKYSHWKIEDFALCFKKAKTLKYGPLYEGIDGAKIMGFMDQYDADYVQEEIEYYRSVQAAKRNEKVEWAPDVAKAITTAYQSAKKPLVTPPEINKQMTEAEKQVQQWMRAFDKFHFKKPYVFTDGPYKGSQPGIKMITRYNKHLTLENFLQHKLYQFKRLEKYILNRIETGTELTELI